jgi:hypothetical protein
MKNRSIETLVGLFVLLGMLGLVFLSLKAANQITAVHYRHRRSRAFDRRCHNVRSY